MGLAEVFGVRVRQLRRSRGWTLETLADAAGMAVTYVGQIERGQRNPSLKVVERFAQIFEVEAALLLTPISRPSSELAASSDEP